MKKTDISKILFIVSVSIFGTIGIFVKFIPLPSSVIALFRSLVSCILIFAFLKIVRQKIDFKSIKRELPLLALSGVAIGANWIFLFEAYKYTTVSVASLSNYFAPVIVMMVCPFIFKDKLSLRQIFFFALSVIGLFLIMSIKDFSFSNAHLIGIFLGLTSALLYATAIIINKLIKSVDGIQRTFWQFLSCTVVLLPYVFISQSISFKQMNVYGWICLATVCIVHTGINYCLYFSSLKDMSGPKVALLSYIDPLISVLLSFLILGEKMTLLQIIGAILLLGSMLLNEVLPNKTKKL